MRDAIREKLISSIVEIGERCFEPHVADANTPKPYVVVRQGADVEDANWTGFRRIIEIWPYVARSRFKHVDHISKKVIEHLHQQPIINSETGETFSCFYLGTSGADVVDEEWDVITRGMRFAVVAIHAISPVQNHPLKDAWLTALTNWSESLLGSDWYVYEEQLELGYQRPCILWRVEHVGASTMSPKLFKVTKRIVGHVLGRDFQEEASTSLLLIRELASAIKLPLSLTERKYMTVDEPKVDLNRNSLSQGQLQVILWRATARPEEEVATINEIYMKGIMR